MFIWIQWRVIKIIFESDNTQTRLHLIEKVRLVITKKLKKKWKFKVI